MKHVKQLMTAVVCLSLITACQKNIDDKSTDFQSASGEVVTDNLVNDTAGHVFVLSNQTVSNKVLTYLRASDGILSFKAAYSTGGKGTAGGLGSQGAVIVTNNKKFVLAVSAGSNEISLLKINGPGLKLLSKVSSGGTKPVSITQYEDLVYVLNAGGDGNISGFRITSSNTLTPIPNSTKPLSTIASGAAQISFTSDGHALVITEKVTNTITSYTVKENGKPGIMHTLPSANTVPFGFAAGRNNIIYVSETGGGAEGASSLSSYLIMPYGSIKLVEGPVSAHQSDACWVALSKDGKYAYVTNTGSDNISAYRVTAFGKVSIASGIAATSDLKPLDASVTSDGKYLYVRNGSMDIHSYTIGENGTLTNLETIAGLPSGATGLATD